MTEKIGLQAVLETSDFERGAKVYDSGIDAMEAANEGFVGSADDVTKGLSAVDEAADESGDSAVDLAAKIEIAEKAYDQIKDTIGQAVELADLGSQMNRTEERFKAFAGEVGDADELLAAFQRGAGGTVDKMTAMSSAGRLLQMGLVSNNDEMEQVVEIATRLGDQTQSAGDRVADFALLLANQSIPRLDNFGISSGKVRARIAELQAAFPAMSREAAFSQAVFEQGAASLDVLGVRTQDAGMKMEIARANIENMRIEMGQRLLPIVAQVFGVIASLDTNTLALIATLGGAAGVFIKFSGGLEAAAANASKLATKMGTSTAALGALAVSMVVLVEAASNLQDTLDGMNAAQDSAQEAASTLGSQVQALVDDGLTLGEAMAQVGGKVNEATTEFNNATILGVIPLKNALNAGSEFSNTMAEATSSLQGAIVANTESYGAYIEQVGAYNAGITDSAGKIAILSEAEFNMATIREKGASAASLMADEILKESLAVEDTGAAADRTFPILGRFNENQERGASKAEAMAGAVAGVSREVGAQGGALDALAAQQQETQRIADLRAASEENQAAVTAAATAALEQKRQADIAVAQEELKLQQAVMGASDAMIAQTFIQALDPDAMGLTAYRQAVEQIQLAFGLATPESIALARGIEDAAAAANAGELNYNKLDDILGEIIEDSKDGAIAMDKYGVSVEESASASADLALQSSALAGELPAVDEGAQQAAEGMTLVTDATNEASAAMGEAAAAAPGHGAAIGSGLRAGMEPEMNSFVASFRDKLNSIRDQLPSSEPKDATSPLYGLSDTGEAIIGNIVFGIESAGSDAVDAMAAVGAGMGGALASALGDTVEGALSGMADDIADDIVFGTGQQQGPITQAVEDLFGAAGVLGGLGGVAGGFFQKEVIDPLEEQAEAIDSALDENRKKLEKASKTIDELTGDFSPSGDFLSPGRIRHIKDAIAVFGREEVLRGYESVFGRKAAKQISELLDAEKERERALERILELQEKQRDVYTELNAEQERLNKLQRQQENLRFLQQQAELLALIAERGLDAADILGGLQLGIDADVGLVMDAMAAAMEQVIAQAEEELGIASPSKVFEQIGRDTMAGMAMGIQELMSLPVAQSALATQSMIAAPAAIVAPRNTSTDNSVNFGDINISGANTGDMGQARRFGTAVIQQVKDSMTGVG